MTNETKTRRFKLNAHRIAPLPVALGALAGAGSVHAAPPLTFDQTFRVPDVQGQQYAGNVLTNGGGTPPLTLTFNSNPSVYPLTYGTAYLYGNGALDYTPNAGACTTGTDTLSYTVEDSSTPPQNGNVIATINLVSPAVPDAYETFPNTAVTGNVRNNDLPQSNTLPVISYTQPAHGTVTLDDTLTNANGQFTYTPNAGFTGVDTFTYSVDPGLGGCLDTANVSIQVGIAQTAPATSNGVLGMLAALLAWFGLRRRREQPTQP